MSGAAQRDETAVDMGYGATGTDGAPVAYGAAAELKQIAAERLAAHRNRRAEEQAREEEMRARLAARHKESRRGSSMVREAVAARYESSVSYREFLAVEADRALQQAKAEAEVAARNAQAMADAQQKLLEEMQRWSTRESEKQAEVVEPVARLAVVENISPLEPAEVGLRVHLYEDAAPVVERTGLKRAKAIEVEHANQRAAERDLNDMEFEGLELAGLEQEIEFRLAPEFAEHSLEVHPLPANIIEFPRQLVAPKKARPRLAEGPLRLESEPEPQLRIFEVEPEQISFVPVAAEPTAAPVWQSLQLDAAKVMDSVEPEGVHWERPTQPQPAAVSRRMMAAMLDGMCLVASMGVFGGVVVGISGHGLRGLPLPLLGVSAFSMLAVMFVVYQMLFFTFADATPGMRVARIAMCTFTDRHPTRKALRWRVVAKLLAACPMGLGVAWMCLDDEKLGWHDRMTRIYPRQY